MNWKLHIGIHRGTLTSRDEQIVKTKYHSRGTELLASLDDVRACAQAWQQNYASMGYSIWFATAIAPDGSKILNVVPSTPYRR